MTQDKRIHPHRRAALKAIDILTQDMRDIDADAASIAAMEDWKQRLATETPEQPVPDVVVERINSISRRFHELEVVTRTSVADNRALLDAHFGDNPEWQSLKFNQEFREFVELGPIPASGNILLTWAEYLRGHDGNSVA